jgi:hypothetical protein
MSTTAKTGRTSRRRAAAENTGTEKPTATPTPKTADAAKPKTTPRKRTPKTADAPKTTPRKRAPKTTPKTETTPRVGRSSAPEHERTAKHATAIMRSGRPDSSRGPVSTSQIATLSALVEKTGGVSKTLDVSVSKLAAYALGGDDADAAAAIRRFGAIAVGVKIDSDGKLTTSRAAHGSVPVGMRKIGGRKLAAALVAIACASGVRVSPDVAKLRPKNGK